MTNVKEAEPLAHVRILCRHPFLENKRAYVTPSSVQCMYNLYWADGQIKYPLPTWEQARTYAKQQIESLRKDHRRYLNPTPYKVSVSDELYSFMHQLWIESVPIGELA
jgi:nicotinate phosphoribosyltransferase